MNVDPRSFYHSAEPTGAIPELSVVALRAPRVLQDGRPLPSGAEGTVVGICDDGEAYIVEFDEPFHVVTTVEGAALREVLRIAP